ncbi:MAG: hypothetical protein U0414_33615 [Polyangiaceae bacterium]
MSVRASTTDGGLAIWSVGASTPVGLSAEQTAFGLRAGLFCPRTLGHTDEVGEPLGAVLLGSIPEEVEGWERLVWLALPAAREALAGSEARGLPRPRRAFLALPSAQKGLPEEDLRSAVDEVEHALLEGVAVTVVSGQNDAFGKALALAVRHLAEHPDECALVGGADSRHAAETYADLDEEFRILSERSPDGFIPGEGAAFAVIGGRVTGAPARSEPRDTPLARIAFADARDESGGEPDAAFTDLVEAAALHAAEAPLSWVLVDQRTEQHRSSSWHRVECRLPGLLDLRGTTVDALAERVGDAGAASGAILLVHAVLGVHTRFAPGSSAVVALGSDGPGRAAFTVRRAT